MAIETKSLADAQSNWTSVTPGRAGVYAQNAISRVAKWATNTVAGIPNFRAAVSASNIEARIRANVQGKGSQRYPSKIREVGQARFSQGVGAAGPDYSSGFGPYLQVIQGVQLPAKGPRGAPQNLQRVSAVTVALHEARLRQVASA